MSPGSIMPSFRYLYEVRKVTGQPSADAVKADGEWAPPAGHVIVPGPEAKALVAYLLSLDKSYSLPEVPEK
jgi:cytochrome c oxidase cbb3-type subunit 2